MVKTVQLNTLCMLYVLAVTSDDLFAIVPIVAHYVYENTDEQVPYDSL